MKVKVSILFLVLFLKIEGFSQEGDSVEYYSKNNKVSTEIYPSPIYTFINCFDNHFFKLKGVYPIPFKSRITIEINDRIDLGVGMEEKVPFSFIRHSQWFITSDYYLIKQKKNSLTITPEIGLYSYLTDETNRAYRGMNTNFSNGLFLRAGITWKKRISKNISSSLFFAYENNLNNPLVPPDDWYLSLRLGFSIQTLSTIASKKDTSNSSKFSIALSVFDNILGRKNDVIIIPFDNVGNTINESLLFKNNMFFLGRITPGIELGYNIRNTSFISTGFFYNKTFIPQNIQYGDVGGESYSLYNVATYFDYLHALFRNCPLGIPYFGVRSLISLKEISYSNSNSNIGPQNDLTETYHDKSRSLFFQFLIGNKFIDRKFYIDAGLALNIIGLINNNFSYHYKANEVPFGTTEFDKYGEYQKVSYVTELLKERYLIKDVYLKIGLKL